jgi:hypothetical protein
MQGSDTDVQAQFFPFFDLSFSTVRVLTERPSPCSTERSSGPAYGE